MIHETRARRGSYPGSRARDYKGTGFLYQVTPQLVDCFDDALGLVKGSLQGTRGRSTSKAAYLHGSFGSGKSHFMAILYLILQGETHARSIPELAAVIAKHNEWMQGKKFLMVPYHLLGAKSLESRVLGGYADFMARSHPEAPTPPVFLAEGLLANAEQLREAMGDAKFSEQLNKGKGGGGGGGCARAPSSRSHGQLARLRGFVRQNEKIRVLRMRK